MRRHTHRLLHYVALGVLALQVSGVSLDEWYAELIETTESIVHDFEELEEEDSGSSWAHLQDEFAPNDTFVEHRALQGFAATNSGEAWTSLWSRPPPRA